MAQNHNQSIVFVTYETPGLLPEPITLTPQHNHWRPVIQELIDLKVNEWASEYNNHSVLDGHEWSLIVHSKNFNIQSSGSNAYPDNFDAVQGLIERAALAPTPSFRTNYSRKPRKCPNCGVTPIASIIYGMPILSEELMEKEGRGEIVFGGCMIETNQPSWKCTKCNTELYKAT